MPTGLQQTKSYTTIRTEKGDDTVRIPRAPTIAVGAVVAVVGLTTLVRASTRLTSPPASTSVPAYVAQIAEAQAKQMGDAAPTSAVCVLTKRAAAEQLAAGAVVDSNPAVYFVVLQGEFKDTQAYLPPGAPAPTGTEIDFTIDPTTQTILDFGIADQPPDVAALGTPTTLSLPSAP